MVVDGLSDFVVVEPSETGDLQRVNAFDMDTEFHKHKEKKNLYNVWYITVLM